MEFKVTTFKIKIKQNVREVVMFSGGFATKTDYRIVEGKQMRRPTSYEYQKIYKKLRKERIEEEAKKNHLADLGRDNKGRVIKKGEE